MKKIGILFFCVSVLVILVGCNHSTHSTNTTSNGNNYTYKVPKYTGYSDQVAPDPMGFEESPKFGYWWEDEMEDNPNWWNEDYIINESFWQNEDYYSPINPFKPNSEFDLENPELFAEDEYQYYRFNSFDFSVMAVRNRNSDEVVHIATFTFTYTWILEHLISSTSGPTIALPVGIRNKLDSGYYNKSQITQFMYDPNDEKNFKYSPLLNNHALLTGYKTGVFATSEGSGRIIKSVKSQYLYFVQPFRPNTYNFMKTQNNLLGEDRVAIMTVWYGFTKSTPFTEEDINEIATSEFSVVFPDSRDVNQCSDPVIDQYICPAYIEAKLGSPYKVIAPVIEPFKFTTKSDSKISPYATLVDEPFIHYMG